jgi:hypothetical protein
MNVNDFFSSKYLGAADLNGGSHIVQISRVETETMQDGRKKPALYFTGQNKALLCNKTNALTIAAKLGPNMNGWIGHSVELFPMMVQGPNGPVQGIRVRVVERPAQPAPAPAPAAPVAPTAPTTPAVF